MAPLINGYLGAVQVLIIIITKPRMLLTQTFILYGDVTFYAQHACAIVNFPEREGGLRTSDFSQESMNYRRVTISWLPLLWQEILMVKHASNSPIIDGKF